MTGGIRMFTTGRGTARGFWDLDGCDLAGIWEVCECAIIFYGVSPRWIFSPGRGGKAAEEGGEMRVCGYDMRATPERCQWGSLESIGQTPRATKALSALAWWREMWPVERQSRFCRVVPIARASRRSGRWIVRQFSWRQAGPFSSREAT